MIIYFIHDKNESCKTCGHCIEYSTLDSFEMAYKCDKVCMRVEPSWWCDGWKEKK